MSELHGHNRLDAVSITSVLRVSSSTCSDARDAAPRSGARARGVTTRRSWELPYRRLPPRIGTSVHRGRVVTRGSWPTGAARTVGTGHRVGRLTVRTTVGKVGVGVITWACEC